MPGTTTIGRRAALGLGLASGAAAIARRARAAPQEVKIGMLMPFTGPWAREGILERLGAEMAIDDVNAGRRHQIPGRREAGPGTLRHPG